MSSIHQLTIIRWGCGCVHDYSGPQGSGNQRQRCAGHTPAPLDFTPRQPSGDGLEEWERVLLASIPAGERA